jgi:hypothetical protein
MEPACREALAGYWAKMPSLLGSATAMLGLLCAFRGSEDLLVFRDAELRNFSVPIMLGFALALTLGSAVACSASAALLACFRRVCGWRLALTLWMCATVAFALKPAGGVSLLPATLPLWLTPYPGELLWSALTRLDDGASYVYYSELMIELAVAAAAVMSGLVLLWL